MTDKFDVSQVMRRAWQKYHQMPLQYRNRATFALCLKDSWLDYKSLSMYRVRIVHENGRETAFFAYNYQPGYRLFRAMGELMMKNTMFIKQRMYERNINGTNDKMGLFYDLIGNEAETFTIKLEMVHFMAKIWTPEEACEKLKKIISDDKLYQRTRRVKFGVNDWSWKYNHL